MSGRYSIGFVASELGVSSAVLRKWESRYGFPSPRRTPSGERRYDCQHVKMLREAVKLIDAGHAPSSVFADKGRWLETYLHQASTANSARKKDTPPHTEHLLSLLRQHQFESFRDTLSELVSQQPILCAVETVISPLISELGNAWCDSRLPIYLEHIASEVIANTLRAHSPPKTVQDQSCVLLTTPPGETHTLGLSMLGAVLNDAGAKCISLGSGLPLEETAAAAEGFDADILCISISSASKKKATQTYIQKLRKELPDICHLWVGGTGLQHLTKLPSNTHAMVSIRDALTAYQSLATSCKSPVLLAT